jgi:cytochrome P450
VYRAAGPQPVRPGFDSLSHVQAKLRSRHGHRGLLVSQKDEWKQFRSKVQRPMLRPKTSQGYIPVLGEIADEFLTTKVRDLRDPEGRLPDTFLQELYKWALESVAVLALDTRLGCLDPDLPAGSEQETLVKSIGDMFILNDKLDNGMQLWRFLPIQGPAIRKLEATCQTFFAICEGHIQRAMEELEADQGGEGREKTMLELFKEQGCDTGVATTMALDMLFAGVDTSSHTIAFALYYLATNPRVQDKLQAEVATSLATTGGTIGKTTFDSMPYLKAVVKETLRLSPPAAVNARTLEQELELGGFLLPVGTNAILCHLTMASNPELINSPEEFLPERWIKSEKEYQAVHPFINLPFGQGARMCVGKRFAELEIYILLCKLIQSFQVSWPGPPLGMMTRTLTAPDAPLRCCAYCVCAEQ